MCFHQLVVNIFEGIFLNSYQKVSYWAICCHPSLIIDHLSICFGRMVLLYHHRLTKIAWSLLFLQLMRCPQLAQSFFLKITWIWLKTIFLHLLWLFQVMKMGRVPLDSFFRLPNCYQQKDLFLRSHLLMVLFRYSNK